MENLRKVEKETTSQFRKEINELEKQNTVLKQKNEIL